MVILYTTHYVPCILIQMLRNSSHFQQFSAHTLAAGNVLLTSVKVVTTTLYTLSSLVLELTTKHTA